MELLSNEALIHCYKDALKLELDQAFIDMLVQEIEKRHLKDNVSSLSEKPEQAIIGAR